MCRSVVAVLRDIRLVVARIVYLQLGVLYVWDTLVQNHSGGDWEMGRYSLLYTRVHVFYLYVKISLDLLGCECPSEDDT